MIISRKYLVENVDAREKSNLWITLHSDLFGDNVRIDIYKCEASIEENITDKVLSSMNMFLSLEKQMLSQIADELWLHYKSTIRQTSYACVPDSLLAKHGGDDESANQEYFGINSSSDIIDHCELKEINTGGFSDENCLIWFNAPWDDEHGVKFTLESGKIVGVE